VQEAELSYHRELAAAQSSGDPFADLKESAFLTLPCQDFAGNRVVMVMPQKLPQGALASEPERLFRFVITQLDSVVNSPYVVVYVHTCAAEQKASANVLQLRGFYERWACLLLLMSCTGLKWTTYATHRVGLISLYACHNMKGWM
jgi:hypothetical protein